MKGMYMSDFKNIVEPQQIFNRILNIPGIFIQVDIFFDVMVHALLYILDQYHKFWGKIPIQEFLSKSKTSQDRPENIVGLVSTDWPI